MNLGIFPRFEDSTVYIQIARSNEKYIYAFEKSVLARASTWFANQFERTTVDCDPKLAQSIYKSTGYEFRFELRQRRENLSWVLVKSVCWREFSTTARHLQLWLICVTVLHCNRQNGAEEAVYCSP